MSKKKYRKVPKFEVETDPDYKLIYATGVFGSVNPNDGRIIFYVDQVVPEMSDKPGQMRVGKIKRKLLIEVHVSPNQFKDIANWMIGHIRNFEKEFGRIPSVPTKKESEGYIA